MHLRYNDLCRPRLGSIAVMLGICFAPLLWAQGSLSPGESQYRAIEAGVEHRWVFSLPAGRSVEFELQAGQLGVSLLGPGGSIYYAAKPLRTACRSQLPMRLRWVSEEKGNWVLVIEAESESTGQYTLRWLTLRDPTAEDLRRARIQRLVAELERALNAGDSQLRRARLAELKAAFDAGPIQDFWGTEDWLERIANAPDADPEITESLSSMMLDILDSAPDSPTACLIQQLRKLSDFYFEQGRYVRSAATFERYLQALSKERGVTDQLVQEGMLELGATYYLLGQYRKASDVLSSALEKGSESGARSVQFEAEALSYLGEVYRAQGDYSRAQDALARAVELGRLEPAGRELAVMLNNLAGLYRDSGRFVDAERLAQESLEIRLFEGGETPSDYLATGFLNLAEIYRFQGKLLEALPLYEKALSIAEKALGAQDPALATYVAQLARMQSEMGRLSDAAEGTEEALRIRRAGLPSNHPEIAQTLIELALLRVRLGDAEVADQLLGSALRIQEDSLGEHHPEVASLLLRWAEAGSTTSPLTAMRVDRAIEILEGIPAYPEELAQGLALKARLDASDRRIPDAIESMTRAVESLENLRIWRGSGDFSRASFLEKYLSYYEDLASWHVEEGEVAGALSVAERSRARVLLDRLSWARVDLRRGVPEDLLQQERQSRARLSEAQQRIRYYFNPPSTGGQENDNLEDLERELQNAALELRTALDRVRGASPAWQASDGAGSRTTDGLEVCRSLVQPEEGAIVYFQIGKRTSYLFYFLASSGTLSVRSLEVPDSLAGVLGIDKGALTSAKLERLFFGGGEGSTGLLRSLRRVVWPWTADLSPGNRERLAALHEVLFPPDVWPAVSTSPQILLVPDGPLHYLPFEVLVCREGSGLNKYWLDVGPRVRYAPSLALQLQLQDHLLQDEKGSKEFSVLSVSDPDFGIRLKSPGVASNTQRSRSEGPGPARSNLRLVELPGSRRESEAIAKLLGPDRVTVLSGSDATESNLRARIQEFDVLHFATHGIFEEDNELLASLVLAAPSGAAGTSGDDGFLQLYEVFELDLNAKLVVLSACETSLGRFFGGEGVFGVSRGFLVAGTPRVVASLWTVDDEASADLVGQFFDALQTREDAPDYLEALVEAKRFLRNSERWAHPYFWAPLVFTGIP